MANFVAQRIRPSAGMTARALSALRMLPGDTAGGRRDSRAKKPPCASQGARHREARRTPLAIPLILPFPVALLGFRGLMLHHSPRSAPPYCRPLQKPDFQVERVTTSGLDDLGPSTTLESNKSPQLTGFGRLDDPPPPWRGAAGAP